jgi:hypothetical protein
MFSLRSFSFVVFAVLLVAAPALARGGNPVVHWNIVATDAFTPTEGTNPMVQSRTLAILHAAIHDAVNAIEPRFEPYTPGLASAPQASVDAAVAAAAREVLAALLPEQSPLVDAAYRKALASVEDAAARDAGLAVGQAAARASLERRQGDGFDKAATLYVPRSGPAEYQFTAPFDFAALPRLGNVQPFVIDVSAHAVAGPHGLSSLAYARDLEYIKELGGITSARRTPQQSEIAKFWYEDSPLGWNRIANTVVSRRGADPWTAARALALVNFAMADGFIAGFDAKYRFRFWRPITAIREAANDGNPMTEPAAAWEPLLVTPPVPDYPSTHTVLGWAAAEVLIGLFADQSRYSATSLTLPGVTRSYKGFSAAAEENGLSRLYAGIHFRHAVNDGKRQGRSIGRAVAKALEPVQQARLERTAAR